MMKRRICSLLLCLALLAGLLPAGMLTAAAETALADTPASVTETGAQPDLAVTGAVADAADADEDNSVTILDATAIQRYLAAIPGNPRIGTVV